MFTIKAYLPVSESFGFNGELRSHTAGQAFVQLVFDHWEQMSGNPLEKGSKMEELVRSVRVRKGLKVCLVYIRFPDRVLISFVSLKSRRLTCTLTSFD